MMLARWRSNPISFIETVLYDPETKKPWPGARAYTPTGERQRDRTACPRAL